MATRPKAVIESRNGEKFSPITITKNVLTDDGQNLHDILSDRKEDMMTPTIENSSSMFKVGQGDNVDYSENVVDGAYESCVLKGRSLVNLVTKNGVIQVGSSANVPIQDTGYSHKVTLTSQGSKVLCYNLKQTLKSNVDYFVYIPSKLSSNIQCTVGFYDGNIYNQHRVSLEGRNYAILRACASDIQLTIGHHGTGLNSGDTLEVFYPILIEYQGGMENWNWNYFEGICDCKSPILSNVGKNLLDIRKAERRGSTRCSLINNGDGSITLVGDGDGSGEGIITTTCYASLKQGKTYTYSFESDGQYSSTNGTDTVEAFLLKDGSASTKVIQMKGFTTTFTCQEDGDYYVRFDVNKNNTTHKFWNVYLAEVSTDNSYEPYKSNTTTFDQKDGKTIVLRSLPSGVCDTLNVETGEYVQRIGEVVLDGSANENWTLNTAYDINDTYAKFILRNVPNDMLLKNSPSHWIANRFKNQLRASGVPNEEGISSEGNMNAPLMITIKRDKLTELTPKGFKRWLAQNPVTVQYELATPIVSTIDIQGFPYAYTNGHVQLSSGSIEQSLTPKVEYSVVTNRNGQIRSNQKMVERHQKQLDQLQAMILTNLVNTQYEQTLTNLKYDLKNVREEVK